jgi:hypothetical protein
MSDSTTAARKGLVGRARLPFFYGWVLVGVAFVTMAIGVNARTAFSLLLPPILDEFQWDRGITAGAFSFGFLISAFVTPGVGWLTDRRGPRLVIETGVVLMGSGLLLASLIREPWQLYLSLGALVGGGVNLLAYTGRSLYLTNWFAQRLALSIAFSGVGVGSVTILPWLQSLIANSGWRTACWSLGLLVLVALAPLNLLLRRKPADLGLEPDGNADVRIASRTQRFAAGAWASVDWTLGRALRAAFPVAGAELFLRPFHVVCGAGPPDEIPDGNRLRSGERSLGIRAGKPCRCSRPDYARLFVGSYRARVGMDDRQWRLCVELRGAACPLRVSDCSIAMADGGRPRNAGLQPYFRDGSDTRGEFWWTPLWQHFRHRDVGGDPRGRSRALDCRGFARFDRQLFARLLALDWL